MKIVKCKRFDKTIDLPRKSHIEDSGMDLFLPNDFSIRPFETAVIGLNLALEVPSGYTSYLVPRSSIAKKGLVVHNALIDPGYTGEIHLIITNVSDHDYYFKKGDRLASLIIIPIENVVWEEKEELGISDRGTNGFGSTGK